MDHLHDKGYVGINGMQMYYEMHGAGKPLVLLHGGGSTIDTSFGRIIPGLAKNNRVIAVELQAHGRTSDRESGLSFRQDAQDVIALLDFLGISSASILGFSNGGQTAIELGIHYAGRIDKLIICSAFYSRSAAPDAFWKGFESADIAAMPGMYKEAFLAVNNNEAAFVSMFNRDVYRMLHFEGWAAEALSSITAPALIIHSSRDVGSPEHAVEMHRLIPNSDIAIFPGGHGSYLGELAATAAGDETYKYTATLVHSFLEK